MWARPVIEMIITKVGPLEWEEVEWMRESVVYMYSTKNENVNRIRQKEGGRQSACNKVSPPAEGSSAVLRSEAAGQSVWWHLYHCACSGVEGCTHYPSCIPVPLIEPASVPASVPPHPQPQWQRALIPQRAYMHAYLHTCRYSDLSHTHLYTTSLDCSQPGRDWSQLQETTTARGAIGAASAREMVERIVGWGRLERGWAAPGATRPSSNRSYIGEWSSLTDHCWGQLSDTLSMYGVTCLLCQSRTYYPTRGV